MAPKTLREVALLKFRAPWQLWKLPQSWQLDKLDYQI